jgi:hypothetical protein
MGPGDVQAPEAPAEPRSEHVPVRFPADLIAGARQLAASEGMTVSAWIRHEVEREVGRRLDAPRAGAEAHGALHAEISRLREMLAVMTRERDLLARQFRLGELEAVLAGRERRDVVLDDKSHQDGCICPDCEGARADAAETEGKTAGA